jgi:hypothetical protein
MPARPFRVARASAGLGIFAVRQIARRQTVVAYGGPWIDNDEAVRRERRGARYLFEVNSKWTIDGSSRRNLGRYINHSCRPNAEPVLRNKKIVFIASRAIAPGEEITFDYGKEYFDLFIKPRGCRCAACVAKAARQRKLKRLKKTPGKSKARRGSRTKA